MSTKCIICNSDCNPFLKKEFNIPHLSSAEYWCCKHCGFVFSKTHYEMPQQKWTLLNEEYHSRSWHNRAEDPEKIKKGSPIPYIFQALLLLVAAKDGLIKSDEWLDYGAGWGHFGNVCEHYLGLKLKNYDKYLSRPGYVSNSEFAEKKWNVLICSGMLEHIRHRSDIDEILGSVASDGAFLLCTRILEKIPHDVQWNYLGPVHCSFFTNKSIQILMAQNGFSCCIFSPTAESWIFFRQKPEHFLKKIQNINVMLGRNFIFECDFCNNIAKE